jgi:hypothetical protein
VLVTALALAGVALWAAVPVPLPGAGTVDLTRLR